MSKNKLIFLCAPFFALSLAPVFGQNVKKEEKLKACGTKKVDFKVSIDKNRHPMPGAPAGKALIYVLRPKPISSYIQSKVAVDGEWVGSNRGNTYFFFTVTPGERFFCSQSENQDYLKLTVEAGKTYYLRQKIQAGIFNARNNLLLLTDEKGKETLADLHLSVSEPKTK